MGHFCFCFAQTLYVMSRVIFTSLPECYRGERLLYLSTAGFRFIIPFFCAVRWTHIGAGQPPFLQIPKMER